MAKKKVKNELGKGIRALLGDDSPKQVKKDIASTPKATDIFEVPLAQIEPNPFQPRVDFIEEELNDLAQSIKTYGIIQPLTLRRLAPNQYQIISGERRFRASKLAGLEKVPAYLRTADDQLLLEMALVENVQRADLNPIEVATSYQRLIDECQLTHEVLSQRVGKKRSSITNYLRLLSLPPQIQTGLKEGKISMGHAKVLAGIDDVAVQISAYGEVIASGLSVRATEQLVNKFKSPRTPTKSPKDSLPDVYLKVKSDLEHKLETKIKLKVDAAGKGSITIPFANTKDLNRLLDILDI